jgi:hypothetical protein
MKNGSTQSTFEHQVASLYDRSAMNLTSPDSVRREINDRANRLYMMGELTLAAELLLQWTTPGELESESTRVN